MKKSTIGQLKRKVCLKHTQFKEWLFFVVLGFCGVLFFVGITIWGSVSLIRYAVSSFNQVTISQDAQDKLNSFKSEFQKIELRAYDCWVEAQSILRIQPWIENKVFHNLQSLQHACLNLRPVFCSEDSCKEKDDFTNKTEGRTI